MRIKSIVMGCVATSVFASAPAMATVIFSDGGTHAVHATSAAIVIENGSTLYVNLGPNASITGPVGVAAISATDFADNKVFITGGKINGGPTSKSFGGSAVEMWGGLLDISGGTFTGGYASVAPGNAVKTHSSQVTIHGGTFRGGSDPTDVRTASHALACTGGSLTITGGDFIGGDGDIGGMAISLSEGGMISPVIHALITGGTFTPGLGKGSGGPRPYAVAVGSGHAAVMDLKGGQFFGDFYLEAGSILNVYGSGLSLTPQKGGMQLAGALLDGTPISVNASMKPGATIHLFNVPEPSGFTLAICALIVGFVSRRSTLRARSRGRLPSVRGC